MKTYCPIGAGQQAADYTAGDKSDWFLPSKDELNAMWLYSQVGGFNTATYGFASDDYWSSSQFSASSAWNQSLANGAQFGAGGLKSFTSVRVRPIRSF